jgi:hypothetical protein
MSGYALYNPTTKRWLKVSVGVGGKIKITGQTANAANAWYASNFNAASIVRNHAERKNAFANLEIHYTDSND